MNHNNQPQRHRGTEEKESMFHGFLCVAVPLWFK